MRCGGIIFSAEATEGGRPWQQFGALLRDRRVNGTPYRTQRELAGLLGITAKELSDIEFGRVHSSPGLRRRLERFLGPLD